jgi:hypothetical protein
MPLIIGAALFFGILAYVAPGVFVAFGQMIDAPRCAIGMDEYCDRDYSPIKNLSGGDEEQK